MKKLKPLLRANSELGSDDEVFFVDNLLEKGEYFYNGVHSNSKMYALRVPGKLIIPFI